MVTIECIFTLKRVRYMLRVYSQMYRTDMYLKHSSIIWPVWLNVLFECSLMNEVVVGSNSVAAI